jgi:hypothetical protein
MNIHQLSVNYLQEHDRILVRINTTDAAELRLWFTRRLTLGLAPILGKIVAEHVAKQEAIKSPYISPTATADPATQQMLADFKKQEHLQKSDFETPFKAQVAQLPLGTEPLLVTEVNMTPLVSGQMQLVFSEKLPDVAKPRSFQIALEPKLTHGFIHLLDKAIEVSMWREGVRAVQEDAAPDAVLHGMDEKPKYLN